MKNSFALVCFCAAAIPGARGMSVTLQPNAAAPVAVGTVVTWTAASDAATANVWYRFRVREDGGAYRVLRDFGPLDSLDWAAADHEGAYEVEVSARSLDTGETAAASVPYTVSSRIAAGGNPVLSPTAHPLVFLYSAPACPAGGRMRVSMTSPEGATQFTTGKDCDGARSMNFYLAGMRPNTDYQVRHSVEGAADGPSFQLTTPELTADLPGYTVTKAPDGGVPNGIVLHAPVFMGPVATDLNGNIVWYYPGNLSVMTRPSPGGTFWGLVEDYKGDRSRQTVLEFDLAGLTVRETNAARVSEQLAAMGMNPVSAFHHEAMTMPGGRIMVLAATERILTGVQGPGDVDVIGDMIVVLDSDMQVLWAWDAFDHLDTSRMATLGEACAPGSAACPPFFAAPQATDWLHGNSLQLTADGNILYSIRHQDWVVKIDYGNGGGSGDILWRLGKDGDFRIDSADPYPWFSHQHDAGFDGGDPSVLLVFDNGNIRNEADHSSMSRGQVFRLDEANLLATPVLNANLGGYSMALGAAQKLPNGDYHFDVGWLPDGTALTVQVDASGNAVYALVSSAPDYRSFRMTDLYTP